MWPFNRKYIRAAEERADQNADVETETPEGRLLRAALTGDVPSRDMAMNIAAVAGCVNLIADTVAMVPFKLYRIDGESIQLEEVADDNRVRLINVDPGDTLDASQLKRAITTDYFLDRGGYVFIEKSGNYVKSLRYVEPGYVSVNANADPIWKVYKIEVNGRAYHPYEFLKVLRNTINGYEGRSIVEENADILGLGNKILTYQQRLLRTGGVKKGFVKSPRKLTADAIKALKEAWSRLFNNEASENVIILNEGLEFQESSASPTEMQINETSKTNEKQICEIFNVPTQMLNRDIGTASEEDRLFFVQYAVMPVLNAIANALNRDLLLESEKGHYKWAADTSELTKADVLKRYQAYEIAAKNGFLQIDEIRYKENLKPYGLDFIKLGLQDVLYYPKTGDVFVPNMNAIGGIALAKEEKERKKIKEELEIESMKKGGGENG